MRNILISVFTILTLGACSSSFFDQTVKVDPPPYVKQLVVHAFLSQNDTFLLCRVTRNLGLLDNAPDSAYLVAGAEVQLFEDGKLKALFQPNGFAGSKALYEYTAGPGFLQSGRTYELKVANPGFPEVQATQIMQMPIIVDSVKYRTNGGITTGGDKLYALDAYLKDAPGIKNYYSISVGAYYDQPNPIFDPQGNVIGYDTVTYDVGKILPETSDDPNATVVDRQVLVSDQFFDGKPYKLSFKTLFNSYSRFRVYIRSVTQDEYLYLISSQKKLDSEGLPIVEPVTVYSNLNGGIGIFGMHWEQAYDVK